MLPKKNPPLFSKDELERNIEAYKRGKTLNMICGNSARKKEFFKAELEKRGIPFRTSGSSWKHDNFIWGKRKPG